MQEIKISNATIEDINQILAVENDSWPEGSRATKKMWEARILAFPEGIFVARVNNKIQGVVCVEIVNYDIQKDAFTWYEITDHGYIKNSHTPSGRFLYGINLSVPSYAKRKTADALFEAVAKLLFQLDLDGFLMGSRIPRYYKHSNIPIEQYVFGPWLKNGKESRKPIDPELCIYFKSGMQPIKIISNYFEDSESLNYGVLLLWPNFFKNNNYSIKVKDEAFSYLVDFFSYLDKTFDIREKRTITRWNLLLPGAGCSWANASGGCYMCGFKHATQMFTHNRLPSPSILKKLYTIGYDKIQRENPEMLTVYNGGSFFNDREIPLETQQWICEQVNMDKTIKTLFVESRAEFVNAKRLNALTSILNGKKLVLGIGLECVTDSVREKCINKGLPIEVYEQAVKIAKSCNVDVLTYVFLKPLFLSEREAIEECVRTIEYAFKTGAVAVALEAAFIQPHTLMKNYYKNGEFRPPWLWSIIEVIRRTHHLGFVYVGKFDDEPAPIATPHNCSRCSFQINKLLQDYRETFNLSLFEEIDCECKSDWLKELNKNLVNN